ncbi:MAG TPA: condensation domain-containing protein [Terriglobales bacterium]|nr:condensation domain-containing protein [Terriglobales bacterium]
MLAGGEGVAADLRETKAFLAELLVRSDGAELYHASLAQERLWFLDQLAGGSAAYNVHVGLWLRGKLNLNALRCSLQHIANRHDTLRTAFRLDGAELFQIVHSNQAVELSVIDVTGYPEPYAEAYARAQKEVQVPFDLSRAPLFRACLFRVTEEDSVFLCTMHHIITDSWSMQILIRELTSCYEAFSNGRSPSLPDVMVQYGDYSEWQRECISSGTLQQQLAYWKAKLENAPPLLDLAQESSREAEQRFQGATQIVPLPADIVQGARELAARCRATPFMFYLAAFNLFLQRHSGQSDVLVGVPVAGRNRVETESLIGFFVNTVVLRNNLSGDPRFSCLLDEVRETTLQAFAHADVPFEKIVEAIGPERNLSYNPVFQVMFSSIRAAVQSHFFGSLTAFPYIVYTNTAILDLSVTIIEGRDGQWWVSAEYDTNLFSHERITGWLEEYKHLVQNILNNPDARLSELPLVSENREIEQGALRVTMQPAKLTSQAVLGLTPGQMQRLQSVQNLLCEIWKDLLDRPSVAVDDNFFDIGGHSLLAARMIRTVEQSLGRKIPVSAIFRASTAESLARLLVEDGVSGFDQDSILVNLRPGDDLMPFFAVAAPQVDTFGFGVLARHFEEGQSVYKLQASEPAAWERPFNREELRLLADQYIAAMRSVQPHGPYCLGGMCTGVPIAQQMVLQLEQQGEEVGLFAIFDTWVLENSQLRPLWAVDYYQQRFRFFRKLSLEQQVATIRRAVKRLGSRTNGNVGSGWNKAYWPGPDFQPPRFDAPVLLFKRPRQPYYYVRDPNMGWGERSRGGVQTCEINCGHIEILREPHIRVVGQRLAARLHELRCRLSSKEEGSLPIGELPSPPGHEPWPQSA